MDVDRIHMHAGLREDTRTLLHRTGRFGAETVRLVVEHVEPVRYGRGAAVRHRIGPTAAGGHAGRGPGRILRQLDILVLAYLEYPQCK